MATLTFLRFLKLFLVSVAFVASCAATRMPEVIEVNKSTNRGSSTLGLGYASFKKEPFSYLNITCLGADLLDPEDECGFACLETPSCFSYNVAAFPDGINGNLLCELLPSEMYNNSEKLIPSKGHHHFSIASQCSSWPCKNKGKCVSLYEENSYVCVCEDGFTGKNCETNVNECDSNPCLNNGTCVDKINGFNCSCPPGFVGNRCEKGFNLTSFILGNNSVYLSNLTAFLAPAVGIDSKWLVCYRASTHGWRVSEFHSRCDGLNHTITIIQAGQYIFGGYTDIPWESSGGHASTSNAFIFSLHNSEGLGPFKSLVKDPSRAIYRDSGYGPTFGGGDIYIADQANSKSYSHTKFGYSYSVPSGVQNQYTILAGTKRFTPDDWEVFYLA